MKKGLRIAGAIVIRILMVLAGIGIVIAIIFGILFGISKLKKDAAGNGSGVDIETVAPTAADEGESVPEILPPSEAKAEQLPEILPPPIETSAEEEEETAIVHEDGWNQEDGVWYYYRDNARITNEWYEEDGGLYYFLSDGRMATGWTKAGQDEYCFYQSGSQIGQLIRDGWSEYRSDGSLSYMGADGRMVKDTIIDGYTIDENGRWVE